MKAIIINIGDELLIGQTVNTNAAWMGMQLNLIGVQVNRTIVIPDQKSSILSALQEGQHYNLVLTTGGLGPTKDDITKHTITEFFGVPLVLNEEVLEDVRLYFSQRGKPLTELNRQQALVPDGARIIRNPNGTAPGLWLTKNHTHYIFMPGVPYEMKFILEQTVLPELSKMLSSASNKKNYIFHHTVVTIGIGESVLAEKISAWEDALKKEGFALAYLPKPGMVRLRISHYSPGEYTPEITRRFVRNLYDIIPGYILGEESFGTEPLTVQKVLLELCRQKKKTLGFAESCTGGYLSSLITQIPGSSEIFKGALITYSNESKIRLLHVDSRTLEEHGAVSEPVVRQMVLGCLNSLHTDLAIAISGVAGPDGGTPDKPVGTVWMAWGSRHSVRSLKFQLGTHRERNIHLASIYALNELRKHLITPG